MDFIDSVKLKYKQLDVLGQLIATVVVVNLVIYLASLLYQPIWSWFALPAGFIEPLLQPWAFITYGFLHGGIFHLLINMYILYIMGQFLLNLFTGKQLLSLFWAGVLAGGLAFTAVSAIFTEFLFNTQLVGASAGVFAVVFFVCTYMPDHEIRLFFVLNVKLKYLALVFLGFDLIAIFTGVNAGGSIAHLGGAALGYYAATRMKDGIDVLTGVSAAGDWLGNLFKSSGKPAKKSKMKTVYKSANKKKAAGNPKDQQARIDAILDKISASGYDSLSRAEKDFLFKAGKE
ncbi:rhomboid family intramembrane serine protease [Nonlabens ponticola]|uniref:Rhomboid family intramembrane serine protease n=1 Tax=Nonlabens ponticola TaxID=2496866 RepID=A0A3S9MXW3_9FLAO|nr:rhomboid family intramembrane serine protease [Nonlabens ponticola]AZQ43972.1 rhomboid family intramembrane serine protease [Nonlabens ponticola]